MRRREFLTVAVGATAWSAVARAQPNERMRRIGVLMPGASDSARMQPFLVAFRQALEQRGWTIGRNLQVDIRWATDADLLRKHATELAAAAPDVILASTNQAVAPLRQATRTVPIVFVSTIDPVGAGDVATLARPGGNATGFLLFEYSISGKWLELLNRIAPDVRRVAVLRDPATTAGVGQFAAIQTVAGPFRVELSPIDVRDSSGIEQAIGAFASETGGGLIVTASVAAAVHHKTIVMLAARNRLPAVYAFRESAVDGGLISYGPNLLDQYRAGAGYVDRILKGEKPADLPVQAPTKYETVVNLRTAKALGLTVPASLLVVADEVVE